MKRIALALSTSVMIVAAGNGAIATEKKLTGAEITNMFTNSTIYFKWQNRYDGLLDYKTGGVLQGAVGNRASDTGRWWVSGDKLCRKWSRWADAKEACATVGIDGDRTVYRWDSGRVTKGSIPKK